MFDCTSDISHTEQMSQAIRYVAKNNQDEHEVKKALLILQICEKTCEYLKINIISKLKKDGVEKNCCGQSYDNYLNIGGVCKGVQARFQDTNQRLCMFHA